MAALETPQIVSIVALIISLTALIWSTLQLIHSYLASAKGYSNINEKVMPGWVAFKKRDFSWTQFRFEVKFETPVLIVCPADNTRFPIEDDNGNVAPHVWINGKLNELLPEVPRTTGAQQHAGHSREVRSQPDVIALEEGTAHGAIHTVNNEQATWMTLLSAVQRMERESSGWQKEEAMKVRVTPPDFGQHRLAVAIQRKRRSWDNMPSSITRPYATTTLCHIIEIAAMLGLHWKTFDRKTDNFLAEGNGYILKSTSVSELGTVFTFQICALSEFKESRIIPVDEVKELAFGFASSIFRKETREHRRRLQFPAEDPEDLSILKLGSANELAETLVSFGCNTQTSNCIRDDTKKHGHLYPCKCEVIYGTNHKTHHCSPQTSCPSVAFEILGMLGRVLHMKHSFYRMLPNPTFYIWNRQYFDISKLLISYDEMIRPAAIVERVSVHFGKLQRQAEAVKNALKPQTQSTSKPFPYDVLHEALEKCNTFLTDEVTRSDTERVLREHIQIVLSMLNEETETPAAVAVPTTSEAMPKPNAPVGFADLNEASSDSKQEKLMEIYFHQVLPKINGSQLRSTPPNYGSEQDTNIWCTLVFRSLCWLFLHDFHKNDKQISKSELLGSRLPVYVI